MSAVGRKADLIRQIADVGRWLGRIANRDTTTDGADLPHIRRRCSLGEISANATRDNDIVSCREC